MPARGVKLTELVDFNRLQLLQDNFASSTGFTSIILDENGNAITRISNPNAFSRLVQDIPHADDGCLCLTSLGGVRAKNDEPLVYTCPYSGFTTVYVPVLYRGHHIASWGILQVRVDDPSASMLKKTAAEFHTVEDDISRAVEETPVFTEADLDKAIGQLQTLIRGLVKSAAPAKTAPVAAIDPSRHIDHTMQLLNKFTHSKDTGMVVCAYENGEILAANNRYAGWMGMSREELIGQNTKSLEAQDFDLCLGVCTSDVMLAADGTPLEPYQWNDYSPLHSSWLRCTNQLVYWLDGSLAHLITFHDISDERRMQDELSRLAYYDQQMSLPNSLKLSTDLELARLRGDAGKTYLICFDVTALRKLNDAHGRKAGDAFLHTVTKWIEHQGFPSATLYRIEGDEFCLLLNGVDDSVANGVAERIYRRFSDLWSLVLNGQQISILCGVSLSLICMEALGAEDELLNIIQRTLDISRKEKKVVVYDEVTDQALKQHIQTQLSLKKCVKQHMNGFDVFYQPIVEPSTGTWKGLEALCRWTSPEFGAVSPMTFIREAEQLGLINMLGEWVLDTAVRQCKQWGLDAIEDFFISVNLSPVQMMSSSLVSTTLEVLERYNYPGNKLSLEVTESTKLNFNNHTLTVIEKLQEHGIMIALDDFGTGYSTFNNMKNLPVRFVKTDHSFIKGIEKDYFMQYFYHIITELAHKTDMRLVVEGVETVEQLEIMLKNGVDYVQGYFFGRPMPAEELETKLDCFTRLNPPLLAMSYDGGLDASLFGGKESYLITTNTFNVQTRCMQILLSAKDYERAFNEVLETIGMHFNVKRAYLYQRLNTTLTYRNLYDWSAKGITPHNVNMPQFDAGHLHAKWMKILNESEMIVASNVNQLDTDLADFLHAHDICSLAVLPIRQDGMLKGFVGFDDSGYRNWQPEEIIMLKNLGLMMASCMKQEQLQASAPENTAEAVMNYVDLPMFVSEMDSGRILWSNRAMHSFTGEGSLVGKLCKTVFDGCSDRCDNCHSHMLLNNPANTHVHREYHDSVTDHSYLIFNTLIPWEGANAQLEYILDVTDMKRAHKQMEHLATTDAMSGALNREALLQALRKALTEAHIDSQPLTIAFLDVDHLREVNDAMGLMAGDILIQTALQTVRGVLSSRDLIGRIGGDEFVLALRNTTTDAVIKKLTAARKKLQMQPVPGTDFVHNFSFGVVENKEVPYRKSNAYVRDLCDIADKRMRAFQKKEGTEGHVSHYVRLFGE